ncbi:MAG: FtsW/RodA/SpoVE family cell cycle protein, partial [Clostridiales bacterium]|nr:FtsW/RodA/SpoVE family cell cycle protein [Clostridiales bacterium]
GRIRLTVSFVALMAYGAIILLFAGLVFLENHLSGTILMVSIGIIMLYLGGFDKKWFIAGIVIVGVVVAVFALFPSLRPNVLQEYMTERIVAWLDKDFEPTGARWQVNQALYAIGSGGFFGAGLGNSKQKYMYVSEPQNDMIFSIVCEELGFVGAVIILLLFAVLVWRGVVIGLKCKSRFGALLSMGIVFHVGLQTVLNIAVATDSIPNTGIGLPFFSYGGSSLLILLAEMGMILSVSRYSAVNKK